MLSLSVLKDLPAGESLETGKLTTRDKTGGFPKPEIHERMFELELWKCFWFSVRPGFTICSTSQLTASNQLLVPRKLTVMTSATSERPTPPRPLPPEATD